MKLYHYTTKESFEAIQQSKVIHPSDPWTTMDASYGRGFYFTDLGPEYCDVCIAMECWRTPEAVRKVQYYLTFEVHPVGTFRKCRNFVYIVIEWILGKITYVAGGPKQRLRCINHQHV